MKFFGTFPLEDLDLGSARQLLKLQREGKRKQELLAVVIFSGDKGWTRMRLWIDESWYTLSDVRKFLKDYMGHVGARNCWTVEWVTCGSRRLKTLSASKKWPRQFTVVDRRQLARRSGATQS